MRMGAISSFQKWRKRSVLIVKSGNCKNNLLVVRDGNLPVGSGYPRKPEPIRVGLDTI